MNYVCSLILTMTCILTSVDRHMFVEWLLQTVCALFGGGRCAPRHCNATSPILPQNSTFKSDTPASKHLFATHASIPLLCARRRHCWEPPLRQSYHTLKDNMIYPATSFCAFPLAKHPPTRTTGNLRLIRVLEATTTHASTPSEGIFNGICPH